MQPGQQITLTISGLPDGASFSLNIGGKFAVTPGQQFSFETRQFTMPFSLTQGTVSATTQGTRTTAFSVAKGDETVQVGNAADANGYFTISKPYEISSGVYDYMTLSGRARTDTSVITSNMNLYGTKKGPSDSVITFTVNGIDNGEVYVTALANGQQVLYKDVIVGNGVATQTPAPVPTDTSVSPTEYCHHHGGNRNTNRGRNNYRTYCRAYIDNGGHQCSDHGIHDISGTFGLLLGRPQGDTDDRRR